MGDESRHYRTDRPGESSVGYARNERDRPFAKRDGWLGPPGYSRGGHPPAPFAHRRGRFDGPHVGSREYLGPDRLQPARPSFQGRGVPPPFHYSPGGPRRGHGPYGPGVDRGRPYHLSEPRGPVYNPDSFAAVPGSRPGHRDPPHDWDSPSGWDGERDPAPPDWSRSVAIQPSGPASAVRAPLRAPPRFAVLDVEAGELPSDGVRPVKTSQWDKGGPLLRAPLPSPNSVASNHVRPVKLMGPFVATAVIVENQIPQEQVLVHDAEVKPAALAEDQPRTVVEVDHCEIVPDVKLEPRNADLRTNADTRPSDDGLDKGRGDGDGDFPALAAGGAAEEHPRASRRRGWGQGLKRLSSATSSKTDNRNEEFSGSAVLGEETEKVSDQAQDVPAATENPTECVAADAANPVFTAEPSDNRLGATAPNPSSSDSAVMFSEPASSCQPLQVSVVTEQVVEVPGFSKAHILTSIEGVDGELSELEKQLTALATSIAELVTEEEQIAAEEEQLCQPVEFNAEEAEECAAADLEVSSDSETGTDVDAASEQHGEQDAAMAEAEAEDHSSSPPSPTGTAKVEITWQAVVQNVLAQNQEAAEQNHGEVAALSDIAGEVQDVASGLGVRSTVGQPLDPQSQARLDTSVRQFLLERQKLIHMKHAALANEYLAQEERYTARLGSDVLGHATNKTPESSSRSTRNSHHTSNTLRSELDYKMFLQRRQAVSELEDMSKPPDMLLDPWQKRWSSFNCRNNLVRDPVDELDEDKLYKENWTSAEKRLFKELFIEHPKDFGKISEKLETRSTAECVVFFYKTQKLDEFAAVRRKQQLKKRRLQCESKRHAVPLVYAPAAKAHLEARGRGRGRTGGRGRGKGAAALLESPVAVDLYEDVKHVAKLEVPFSRVDREDSTVTEDGIGLVRESPSKVVADTGRSALSPRANRTAMEPPKPMSPVGHRQHLDSAAPKISSSPSSRRSPTELHRSGSGLWPALSQKNSAELKREREHSAELPKWDRDFAVQPAKREKICPAELPKREISAELPKQEREIPAELPKRESELSAELPERDRDSPDDLPNRESEIPADLQKPDPAAHTPPSQKQAPSTPKASANAALLTPVSQEPIPDNARAASGNLLTPLANKIQGNTGIGSEAAGKAASNVLPSPTSRPLADASTRPPPDANMQSASNRDQIPGLSYSNYSSWDEKEFVKAVRMFGNDPYKISDYLGTKTVGAVKMYFSRNKKRLGLENVATVRRNPYADELPAGDLSTPPPDINPNPIMATLKAAAAAVASPTSLLNLSIPSPAAPASALSPTNPSPLVIAPLSPLPPSNPPHPPQPIRPEPPNSTPPSDTSTQAAPDRQPATSSAQTVSLFQPSPGGPGGGRGDTPTHISDLLLLQGDNYKHSLPDLSSLFTLSAFQPVAGVPGSPATTPSTLLTSLPGIPSLGRAVSASTPSLFTNQPYQHSTGAAEAPATSHPARQASAAPASESLTPRGSDDTASAVPLAGPRRAASLWSSDEKDKFLEVFKKYGKAWQRLQEAIPTKSLAQIKTYYQNYKTKLGLDKMDVPQPVPKFEASGGKRRQVGGRAGRSVVTDGDEAPVAAPHATVQPSYLQEAARAWDASKDLSLPGWPPLNVQEDEPHPPKSASPPLHLHSSLLPIPSRHHPTQLSNQPSPFTNHQRHPSPPPNLPLSRPDSREQPAPLPSLPILDAAQLAAAALTRANSGTPSSNSMEAVGIERLDSMLAAYIRSLPENNEIRLNLQQLQQQQLASHAASSTQPAFAALEPPPHQHHLQQQHSQHQQQHHAASLLQQHQQQQQQYQQQQQRQQQQQLPPVAPLRQQLEDVRVLGHNLHLHTPVSAASATPPPQPSVASALDLERRDQLAQTNTALLALLQKTGLPLAALSSQHPLLPPPPAPITSSALSRIPILDASILSSLGLTSMYSAAGLQGTDALATLAQQTLLSSNNRPSPHLAALNPSVFSQPNPPSQDYINPATPLHNLPLHILSSLSGLTHSSTDSALLALATASVQQADANHGSSASSILQSAVSNAPTRVPTPKALDLHGDDNSHDGLSRPAVPVPRKVTDLNMGPGESLAQQLLSGRDMGLTAGSPGGSLANHRGGRSSPVPGGPADKDSAGGSLHGGMYFPPAKRARYDDMPDEHGVDEGQVTRMDMGREAGGSSSEAAAAAAGLLPPPPHQSPAPGPSTAQMMLQLAAGGWQFRDASGGINPAAAGYAASAAAAARDANKPPSRQFMEAELARYMQTPYPDLDLGSGHGTAELGQDHRLEGNGGPLTAGSMLGLEPLRLLSMLSSSMKPDGHNMALQPSVSIQHHLTAASQDPRQSILTNPDILSQLPFHNLKARAASSQLPVSAPGRVPSPNPASLAGMERLLPPDMMGVSSAAGLATMQLRDVSAAAASSHLPQWLTGVARTGMGPTVGLSHPGAGLDLNRLAPPGLSNALSAGLQHAGSKRAASPLREQPPPSSN